ncbi:hypothetical protein [Niveispirillum sp. KHB5.9]|uniref:hypothetical protein n=1 Tax=Niveispirillum sp. KHB5.9 TaxID=3400269 RepID=UPI003A88668D
MTDQTQTPITSQELDMFLRSSIDPARFSHVVHLRMAYATIRHHGLETGLHLYRHALCRFLEQVGKPDRYHVTVTTAFMAVVADRMGRDGAPDSWVEFHAANPDLSRRDCLSRWYSPELLDSDQARRSFVLPDRASSLH